MAAIVLAVLLVAYNNAANLWPPFNKQLFVPMNLAAAAAVAALAFGALDLGAEEVGIAHLEFGDALLGIGAAVVLTAPLFVIARSSRWRRALVDERVSELRGGGLALYTLVRIPLGTALLEELAFRGVLFGAWSSHGKLSAAVFSSVAFGLWHIAPTLNAVRANRPEAATGSALLVIGGAVAFTTVAGLALVWLRIETSGLAAPFFMHASVNSLATVASTLAADEKR